MSPSPRSSQTRLRRLIATLAAISILAAACGDDEATLQLDGDVVTEAPADYQFVIPLGAGDALDAGSPLEILPARLDTKVGEIIEIVNEDERGHLVGPFFVGAHETLRQKFSAPGEFEGVCTVHPSGEIVVAVTE